MITHSQLHYTILQYIIQNGFAPDVEELCGLLDQQKQTVIEALYALQEYHGVVLHPNEPKIWVIHPFSLAPTNFLVQTSRRSWWGNCAWCSLGVAALLKEDLSILTSYGAHGEPLIISIKDGEIQDKDLVVHFPIPMKQAWDNVIYTCSNMLVFKNRAEVERWSIQHQIPVGDIQPISTIWEFSKKWYGNHLDPNWRKWTVQEAKDIFQSFGLTHEVWQLEATKGRF